MKFELSHTTYILIILLYIWNAGYMLVLENRFEAGQFVVLTEMPAGTAEGEHTAAQEFAV